MTPAPATLRIVPDTPCVPWTGRTYRLGSSSRFPVIRQGGRRLSARRAIYECCYGPLDPKIVVVTRCDLHECVEPAHLVPISRRNLSAAVIARNGGRSTPRGESHGAAKLTAADVAEIRRLYKPGTRGGGPRSATAVAARYEIDPRHVRNLAARTRWARRR